MNKEKITGRLENWKWSNNYKGSLEGNIFDDSKGRFRDDDYVHTSEIVECNLVENTGFVKTLNSYYTLGKKA